VSGRPRDAGLAVLLAAVAGFVDAAGYLLLHGLFVAHITGNTDRFGQALGRGSLAAAAPIGLAVLEWTASIAAATLALEVATRRELRSPAATALALEAALVAALMSWQGAGFYVREVLAVSAMGTQTAAVAKWGRQTIRTTYLSGMLTRLAQNAANLLAPTAKAGHSYLRDTLGLDDRRRSALMTVLYVLLWIGFAAGGAFGAWATLRWRLWGLGFPLGGLVVALALELA
jgi:uncharacterized membrane protein YoaK (UPF0700 family)